MVPCTDGKFSSDLFPSISPQTRLTSLCKKDTDVILPFFFVFTGTKQSPNLPAANETTANQQ